MHDAFVTKLQTAQLFSERKPIKTHHHSMLSKDPQKEAEYGRQLLICIQVCVSRPANCMNTSTSRSKKKLFTDAKMNSLAFNLKDYGSENFWVTYSCTSPNKLDCQVSQMGSDNKQPLLLPSLPTGIQDREQSSYLWILSNMRIAALANACALPLLPS